MKIMIDYMCSDKVPKRLAEKCPLLLAPTLVTRLNYIKLKHGLIRGLGDHVLHAAVH